MRFIMLYRECMNEYGWIKRRETLNRAKVSEEDDEVVRELKVKEGYEKPTTPKKKESTKKK